MSTRIIPEIVTNKMSGATLAASLCVALTTNSAFAGSIERISVDNGNIQFNYTDAHHKALSDDGRYIVFNANIASNPTHLVHTYLRDRATGITELVSIANDGSTSGNSTSISVSDDGRYVAFTGSQLDGSVGYVDAYVRDRATNTTELISVNSDGSSGTANKSASDVSISGDGRYVAFVSDSADIVSSDSNGVADVFVRDRVTGITQRISIASDGTQSNGTSGSGYRGTDVSADGRYVAFNSSASNLVPNDTNGTSDLFIHDRVSGSTTRVNLASDSAGFDLSSNGRYVAFGSNDSNLVANDSNGQGDIFVRDLVTNTVERVSIANDGSQANSISLYPGISANGRYVSFNSMANNLVTGGNPQGFATFVHDRVTNTTEMVDVAHDGSVANNFSFGSSAVSGDGRYIVFPSSASNLVAGDSGADTNLDIFIHDRISGQICQ